MLKRIIFVLGLLVSINLQIIAAPKYFIGGIIDDVIDSVVDSTVDRLNPIVFTVKDLDISNRVISKDTRQIQLKLQYRKSIGKIISLIAERDLEEILNNSLEITLEDPRKEEILDDYIDLDFGLEIRQQKASDGDYFEAIFNSKPISVDQVRLYRFVLDVGQIKDDLNLDVDISLDRIERRLRFIPIRVDIDAVSLMDRTSSEDQVNLFERQQAVAIFNYANGIDLSQGTSLIFQYNNKNNKILKPKAKSRRGLTKLIASDTSFANFTQLESGEYQVTVDFALQTKKENQAKRFKAGKSYKINLPIQVVTKDAKGLETRFRMKLKTKL